MNNRIERVVRWLLVLPAAAVGFFLTFMSSIWVHSVIDRFCPGIDSGAGGCPGWYAQIAVYFAASIAPIIVVVFGGLMAPEKRTIVVWSIYAVGLFIAIAMGHRIPSLPLVAAFTGAIAAAVVPRVAGERCSA